jgi:hypothetical protein
MQPELGRRRHRRSDITIFIGQPGLRCRLLRAFSIAAVEVRRGFVRFVPCHEGPFPLLGRVVVLQRPQKALYADLRFSPVWSPSGLTLSSVLKCGLINHRDGVATYAPCGVTPRRL